MGAEWYYVRDGQRVGPRMREELDALFATGQLVPDTPVWSPGMAGWTPAHQTAEFGSVRRQEHAAPPVPVAEALASPHPWHRWLARILDVGFFGGLLGMVMGAVAPDVLLRANDIALNLMLLALWVPVETLLISAYGTTPGKALLRIRVVSADGYSLGAGTALERSFQVWMRGLGFGVPVVSLVTMILSYSRLEKQGATAWDHALGVRVAQRHVGAGRWMFIAAIVLGVLWLAVMGARASGEY
jgi:uncharacterized RDD family membrane protein YckC